MGGSAGDNRKEVVSGGLFVFKGMFAFLLSASTLDKVEPY